MKGRRSWMIALAVMVLAAGAMTAVYSYSQKEEKKQQENVADKDAAGDKGKKKEDGASDNFVATLPEAQDASEQLAEADSIIKPSDNAVASKDSDGQAQSDSEQTGAEENAANAAAEAGNESETKAAAATTKTLHFAAEDGLNWPLQGNVILNYSMDQTVYFATLDQYKYNPAVIIAGEVNDRVSAAAEGKVTDISNSAVTGCTVTMDLGDGYSAIYGQLKEVPYEVGDIVGKGKLVGYIAEPTKYYSVEGSNLYFALQKDGEPVDPVSFFE
ncbi:peptidoglycan DD-metalloendopeptidase family protein [Thermoguttaceae bacterium LCP21S3_D4]|nr:M23 family metallopeptidase [Lachnospiraceae bacterium]MDD6303994.1 M23 family metallopeptidase [Lachnospiraceae bacterium]